MSEPVALAASPLDGPDGAPVLVLGNSLGTSRDCWALSAPVLARLEDPAEPAHGETGGARGPW